MRVSPQSSNRMVDGARSVLNDLLADVYIFTDHMTGLEAGQSPGYGLMLVAETTTGCFISSESTANTHLKVRCHASNWQAFISFKRTGNTYLKVISHATALQAFTMTTDLCTQPKTCNGSSSLRKQMLF